jgi:hypothetical protein
MGQFYPAKPTRVNLACLISMLELGARLPAANFSSLSWLWLHASPSRFSRGKSWLALARMLSPPSPSRSWVMAAMALVVTPARGGGGQGELPRARARDGGDGQGGAPPAPRGCSPPVHGGSGQSGGDRWRAHSCSRAAAAAGAKLPHAVVPMTVLTTAVGVFNEMPKRGRG